MIIDQNQLPGKKSGSSYCWNTTCDILHAWGSPGTIMTAAEQSDIINYLTVLSPKNLAVVPSWQRGTQLKCENFRFLHKIVIGAYWVFVLRYMVQHCFSGCSTSLCHDWQQFLLVCRQNYAVRFSILHALGDGCVFMTQVTRNIINPYNQPPPGSPQAR